MISSWWTPQVLGFSFSTKPENLTPLGVQIICTLASSNNVHSIAFKDDVFTDLYWDEFATLPAIVPKGPIAILGLGAGTAARLMLDLWPSLHLEGWEIDSILVDKAREYFHLSDLEKHNNSGGFLSINIADAFSPSASSEGKFAGIVVDLFCDGEVSPQLKEVDTWLELKKRLMPLGRLMVNCGSGYDFYGEDFLAKGTCLWMENPILITLSKAFPGKLWWKKPRDNYLAFTGPKPDFDRWSADVHFRLRPNVKLWNPL